MRCHELSHRSQVRTSFALAGRGLSLTVVLTLALGIGANAAIFSVVRGVLLRPLVNRDEDRLIYIRQSAPGINAENAAFSVPEIQRPRGRTQDHHGDRRLLHHRLHDGRPRRAARRSAPASSAGRSFEVMGLRPVLGRLLNAGDDGPNAAGAAVLTHRFWTTTLERRPDGRSARRFASARARRRSSASSSRRCRIRRKPRSSPNVVTSPHHLVGDDGDRAASTG